MLPAALTAILFLLIWGLLWVLGGLWLARAAFRLPATEERIVGLALGWIIENWLVNLLAWFIPAPVAFWLAPALVFGLGLAGLLLAWHRSGPPGERPGLLSWLLPHPVYNPHWLLLGALMLLFFSIGRGLAFFDDFAHLPTVSLMAAGDIPPHFSLDPQVVYGYHHFLLLFQAQLIRIGGLPPWAALDAGRALSFGLAILLAGLYTHRLTRSLPAALLGSALLAFGSGTRWLLLLLPGPVLDWLGGALEMQGSGAASGTSLAEALQNPWAIEGIGVIDIPFAFANGIYPPGVLHGHSANGLTAFIVLFLLLLTFNRWRGWPGAPLTVAVISVWGLLGEAELVGIVAGWGLVTLAYLVTAKTWRLPRSLWNWLVVAAAGCLLGFVQGGAWTDLLVKTAGRLAGQVESASYQTIGFQLAAPAVVSSHLGVLPILDPRGLLLGLLEIGPVLLVLPLLGIWGIKAFRQARWYEAATVVAALLALMSLFVQFTGSTGVRNTPRLYIFVPVLVVFAVPLLWLWAARRSAALQMTLALLALITMFGGLMAFGAGLVAAQRPVYSYFLSDLDARMWRLYWNRLEPGSLVYDPDPPRATTLFGLHTDSAYTWYDEKPQWKALRNAPDPYRLRAAGFRYAYLDNRYLLEINPADALALSGPCVEVIEEFHDAQDNFRRLLDLDACR